MRPGNREDVEGGTEVVVKKPQAKRSDADRDGLDQRVGKVLQRDAPREQRR